MIKFMKYYVIDTETKIKARVYYRQGYSTESKDYIVIYNKDYNKKLSLIFKEGVINNSDILTDYHEEERIRIYRDSPYYRQVLQRVE